MAKTFAAKAAAIHEEAERMCASLGGMMHDSAVELAENVLFMAYKLRETRETMGDQELVVAYNNGGGQSGVRENPVFKAYEALNRQYVNSIKALNDLLGSDYKPDAVMNRFAKFAV